MIVRGRVVDPEGGPVAGAQVPLDHDAVENVAVRDDAPTFLDVKREAK